MNDELKAELKSLGLTDEQITAIGENLGVVSREDMTFVTVEMLTELKLKPIAAAKVVRHFKTSDVATTAPLGEKPSKADVESYAKNIGMDSGMLMAFMFANAGSGAGLEMDLSSFMPLGPIVAGYSPKRRDMSLMVMGQIERRLETPIVIINADGSVNAALTEKYILSLEEGFDPAEDAVFYDEDGSPYEVVRVGVDAQGIYDADPIDSTRALQQNGMGIGRINWHSVPLEVRQVAYFATRSGELSAGDESKLQWLRTNIKPETKRLDLRSEFPKAIGMFNEANRTGSLPTLRVTLGRGPRRKEVMPRRRLNSGPRDLSGLKRIVGDPGDPDQ